MREEGVNTEEDITEEGVSTESRASATNTRPTPRARRRRLTTYVYA
jgi:hypothetical protein